MAEYDYLNLLYDAWRDAVVERPKGIEFDTLVEVCKQVPGGMSFPHHKLCSDPEFNAEALQLIHHLYHWGGKPSTAEEEIRYQYRHQHAQSLRDSPLACPGGNTKIVAISGSMGAGKTYTAAAIKNVALSMGMPCTVESFGRKLKQFCSEYLEYVRVSPYDWELLDCDTREMMDKYAHHKTDLPLCVERWVETDHVELAPPAYISESCLVIDPRVSASRIYDHLERNLSIALRQHMGGGTALTARRVLQIVASVFRDLCGDDFWVSQMSLESGEHATTERRVVIIDDLRFGNEARWIKRQGGYILHVDVPSSATQPDGTPAQISRHVSETSMDLALPDDVLTNNHAGLDDKFARALCRVGEYLSK